MEEKETDMIEFERKLDLWLEGAQKIVNTYFQQHLRVLWELQKHDVLELRPGRRYVKVIALSSVLSRVFAFIDKTNGDVLMAASWKAPAKTARGNIFNPDDGLSCVTPFGIQYLK
jgi:hypothetical protein